MFYSFAMKYLCLKLNCDYSYVKTFYQHLTVFKYVKRVNRDIRNSRSLEPVWLTKSSSDEFSFSALPGFFPVIGDTFRNITRGTHTQQC